MAFVTTFYPFYVHGTVTKQLGTTEEFIFEWEEVVVGILAASMTFPVNCIIFYVARNVAPVQSYTTVYSSRYCETDFRKLSSSYQGTTGEIFVNYR